MLVREAQESDFEGVAEITAREVLEGYAHFGTEPPTADELIADWISLGDRYPVVVAVEDEQVLGFAKAYTWKPRGAYRTTAEVGVYVRPERQGQGIGRALYEVLFPQLECVGLHTLIAGIALPNDASVRLHERFGMCHCGTLPEMGFKQGRWIDVGYWVKVLGEPERR
jgi:L-amino acid N-acyltransferase YncA